MCTKTKYYNLYNLFYLHFYLYFGTFLLWTFCFTTSSKLSVITAPAADPPLIPVCNPTHEQLHKYCAASSVSPSEKKKDEFCIRLKPFQVGTLC